MLGNLKFNLVGVYKKKKINLEIVKLITFPKCNGQLIINGSSYFLAARLKNSEWHIVTKKVPANTKKIKISFKGTSKDKVVIAINKISVYQ